jgi:hypothetical protein
MAPCWRFRDAGVAAQAGPADAAGYRPQADFAIMMAQRQVVPELLDSLPVDDPLAIGSRADLRRINRIMGAQSLLIRALDPLLGAGSGPARLVEIGAGDGSLLLRVAQRRAKDWPQVHLGLLDLQPVVSGDTLQRYRRLGWDCEVLHADVFDWLARDAMPSTSQGPDAADAPIIIANLFLHHFEGERLAAIVAGMAARARAVVCIEPRRSRGALVGSHLLGAIGCNRVTRHDAVVSVRAGFRGSELTALWPQDDRWRLDEGDAGLFSHRFVAVRAQPPSREASA